MALILLLTFTLILSACGSKADQTKEGNNTSARFITTN